MEVVGTPTPDLLKKICSEHVRERTWMEWLFPHTHRNVASIDTVNCYYWHPVIPETGLLSEWSIRVSVGMIDHYQTLYIVTWHELNADFHLQAQKYIQSLPFMPQQDLEKIFRGANPLGGWCTADWITNLNVIEWLPEDAGDQVALPKCQWVIQFKLVFNPPPLC